MYRATDLDVVAVYPLRLYQRLPRFRIPLRHPDPDVTVDMQTAFGRCYDMGRYADLIDYTQPAPVPLSLEEQAWAAGRLGGWAAGCESGISVTQ